MRMFENVQEAYLEIKRDLAKSPKFTQTRVQHLALEADVREAMNYVYTIMEFPETLAEYLQIGTSLGALTDSQATHLAVWIPEELEARLEWQPGRITEHQHPALSTLLEGNEPSYTYTDRLRGATESLLETIAMSPDTRRAFWPIFQPEDSVRAMRMTRIPCSVGYQFALRDMEFQDSDPYLHMTYLMRSCDFGTFWWSDLWLARQFQKNLVAELAERMALAAEDRTVQIGHLTHIVLSLHSFIDGEIY